MNINEYTNLSKIIAAYLKLDFQTDVMTRLAKASSPNFRSVCFISDEYAEYCTATDANFFAQSREAKCINIVATQSYTSLLNTLHEQSTVNVIIQNLINKLWFRSDDIFTIESAQKQIGKEDKEKISRGISENAKETVFSYFTNSFNFISILVTSIKPLEKASFIFSFPYSSGCINVFLYTISVVNDLVISSTYLSMVYHLHIFLSLYFLCKMNLFG